jgi:hypothetical protein
MEDILSGGAEECGQERLKHWECVRDDSAKVIACSMSCVCYAACHMFDVQHDAINDTHVFDDTDVFDDTHDAACSLLLLHASKLFHAPSASA